MERSAAVALGLRAVFVSLFCSLFLSSVYRFFFRALSSMRPRLVDSSSSCVGSLLPFVWYRAVLFCTALSSFMTLCRRLALSSRRACLPLLSLGPCRVRLSVERDERTDREPGGRVPRNRSIEKDCPAAFCFSPFARDAVVEADSKAPEAPSALCAC